MLSCVRGINSAKNGTHMHTTQDKFCNSYKHVFIFYIGEKIETNIHVHLEEPFYLFTKTWEYGGCVFGPDIAG